MGAISTFARLQGLFIDSSSAAPRFRVPSPDGTAAASGDVELVVVGLSTGCGTTTVAIGLALALIERGRDGNLITIGAQGSRTDAGPARLGALRLWDVPTALREPSDISQYGGVVARIAGGRGMGARSTATVWDLRAASAAQGAELMDEVGTVVAVARGDSDPALTHLAAEMLSERHQRTILVANRASAGFGWERRAQAVIPDSRLGVRQVGRGRLAQGGFADALRGLAALTEAEDG